MILVAAALLCLASVPLRGGSYARLGELRFRLRWAALLSLTLQVLITTVVPGATSAMHEAVHIASYVLAAACVVANFHITGLPVLAAGAACNMLAIVANHGVMPASARAMEIAGLTVSAGFANSAPVADPRLLVLGDVIPVPGPWPLGNVVSIGDLLIITGLLIVVHAASRRRVRDIAEAPARSDATAG